MTEKSLVKGEYVSSAPATSNFTAERTDSVRRDSLEQYGQVFPNAAYLSLGVTVAWLLLMTSGTAWISDVTNAEAAINYIFPPMAFGGLATCIFAILVSEREIRIRPLGYRTCLWLCAVVSSAGGLIIVAAGPYFIQALGASEMAGVVVFCIGAAVGALGSMGQLLMCGNLYARLTPAKAVLQTAFACMLAAMLALVVSATPFHAAIAPGAPSWFSIVFIIVLPLVAAVLLSMAPDPKGLTAQWEDIPKNHRSEAMPARSVIFKLVLPAVFLSAVCTLVHFVAVGSREAAESLTVSSILLYCRLAFSLVVIIAFRLVDYRRLSLTSFFARACVVVGALVALVPAFGPIGLAADVLIGLLSIAFEFLCWCVLCFVAIRRDVSAKVVFAVGFAAYFVGGIIGWYASASMYPAVAGTGFEPVVFGALALILLALVFGSRFDKGLRRFLVSEGDEHPIEYYLFTDGENSADAEDATQIEAFSHASRLARAVNRVAEECGLTDREKEVAFFLARGLANDRIAAELYISVNTVRTHAKSIYQKTDLHSRQEFMAYISDLASAN